MKKQDTAAKIEMLESLFSAESVVPNGDDVEGTRSSRRISEKAVTEGLRRAQIDHIAALYESEIKLRDEVEALKATLKSKSEQSERDQAAIEELSAQNEELKARGESQTERISVLERKSRELHETADESEAKIEEFEEKIEALEAQVATEARLRVDAIKRIQEEANRKLSQIADEKWALELQIEELKKTNAETESRVQQVRVETDNYAQNYHIAVNEVSKLRVELASKDGELAQMRQKFDYELKIRDARMPQGNLADALREARQEFQREISALKADSQQTIQVLKNEQSRLEGELASARENASQYKREILTLQVEMEKAQLDFEKSLAAKETETDRALKARDVRILDLEATQVSLTREHKKAVEAEAALRQQINETEHRLKIIEEQAKSDALAKQSEFQQAVNARDLRIQELKGLCDTLERECSRLLDVEQRIKGDFEKFEDKSRTIEDQLRTELNSKQNEYIHSLTTRDLRIHELKSLCDSLERDHARLAESENRIRTECEKMESKYRTTEETLRADLVRYQNESSTVQVQLAVAREQLASLKDERQEMATELETAQRLVSELREAVIQRASDVQAAKEGAAREIADSRKRSEALEAQLFESRGKIQELEGRIERLQRKAADDDQRLQTLRAEADAAGRIVSEERARSKDHGARLDLRENQLRVYSSALSKEKAELQKTAKKLAKEIRMLSATHPLKDYVAATEFELSKVEIQLKKTPTLSSDRTHYEEYLTKLVEQRDFLKGVLGSSQRQYEAQVAEIERLVSSTMIAPVPPPPVKAASTKTISAIAEASSAAARAENRVEPRWEKPLDSMA